MPARARHRRSTLVAGLSPNGGGPASFVIVVDKHSRHASASVSSGPQLADPVRRGEDQFAHRSHRVPLPCRHTWRILRRAPHRSDPQQQARSPSRRDALLDLSCGRQRPATRSSNPSSGYALCERPPSRSCSSDRGWLCVLRRSVRCRARRPGSSSVAWREGPVQVDGKRKPPTAVEGFVFRWSGDQKPRFPLNARNSRSFIALSRNDASPCAAAPNWFFTRSPLLVRAPMIAIK